MSSGKGRGGGAKQPLSDAIGKPRVERFDDWAELIGDISELEQGRRLALQEPLRTELFGGTREVTVPIPERFRGLLPGDPQAGRQTIQIEGAIPSFLRTGEIPEPLAVPYQLHHEAIAQQGQQAREDIVRSVGARGGQLKDLLGEQRLSEAMQRARVPLLEADLRNALFQQALGTAVGQEFPIVQGFGTAGDIQFQGEDLNLRFKEQFTSNLGFAAGGGFGGG
jgi:hypothetical protein